MKVNEKLGLLEKRKRNPKKTKQISYIVGEDVKIKREVNSILLPYFSFSKKERVDYAKYKIRFGMRDGIMEVRGMPDLGIPTEFDYKVFLAILTIYEENNYHKTGNTVTFSINTILQKIGLSKGGRNYELIKESIYRLKRTTYTMRGIFIKKIDPSQTSLIDNIPGISEDINNTNVSITAYRDPNNNSNIIVLNEEEMSIFDKRESEEYYSMEGKFLGGKITLHFSDVMMNNIRNKYYKTFSSKKLLSLGRGILSRVFEIIEFQRNDRLKGIYKYHSLIMMIPLDAKNGFSKNCDYINGYMDELQKSGYIKKYSNDKENIFVEFFNDSDKKKNIKTIIDVELFGKIEQLIIKWNKENKQNILPEHIYDIVINSKIKENDIIFSNLDYSLEQSKDNLIGFFRNSLEGDWARDIRKTKEKIIEQLSFIHKTEINDLQKEKKDLEEKKRRTQLFNDYIQNKTEEEILNLFTLYNIKQNSNKNIMLTGLRMILFSEGILI